MTQDFNVRPSSAMDAPFAQGGYANSMMPHFNLFGNHSGMAAPYVPGGYTSLLNGIDQDATMQTQLSLALQNATQLYCIVPKGRGNGTDAKKPAILGSKHTLMHMHKYIPLTIYQQRNITMNA